jgi:lipoprotein-anchoring transpeptidase ErfK/SrfK
VNDPEYYRLEVQWAMRLTNSGEFIHAAPWSVAKQGKENVSHGCTGMSTENAKWLYDRSRIGDVVIYTGSNRPMQPWNGIGLWNTSYDEWKTGSALA